MGGYGGDNDKYGKYENKEEDSYKGYDIKQQSYKEDRMG